MELIPVWVGVLLSALAVIPSVAALRRYFSQRWRAMAPAVLVGSAVLLLLTVLTLPTQPPWSPGQTLWPGMLLGGLAVGLGALLAPEANTDARTEAQSLALQAGIVSLGVLILVYLYWGRVLDSLAGFAVGALVMGALLASGSLRDARAECAGHAGAVGAESTALLAVALATTTYLAAFHRSPLGVREWLPLPALLVAALAAALAARAVVSRPDDRGLLMSVAVIGVPLLVVLGLIAGPLHGSTGFAVAYLAGALVFLAVAELAWRETDAAPVFGTNFRLLSALLLLGGALVAYRALHGYGLGLAALGAVTMLGLERIGRGGLRAEGAVLRWAVVLLLTLVLFRCYVERTGYSRGFTPDFFYFYVALVVGALLPGLLGSVASFGLRRGHGEAGAGWSSVVRSGAAALVAVVTPLAAWVLVGPRPQAALLLGLTVAAAVSFRGPNRAGSEAETRTEPLQRLGVVIAAVTAWQFTHLLEPLAMLTRLQRVGVLVGVGILVLGAVGVGAWLERRQGAATATG